MDKVDSMNAAFLAELHCGNNGGEATILLTRLSHCCIQNLTVVYRIAQSSPEFAAVEFSYSVQLYQPWQQEEEGCGLCRYASLVIQRPWNTFMYKICIENDE